MECTACQLFLLFAKVVGVLTALVVARGILWLVNLLLVAPRFDPLRNLPGPDASAFQSHFSEVNESVLHPTPSIPYLTHIPVQILLRRFTMTGRRTCLARRSATTDMERTTIVSCLSICECCRMYSLPRCTKSHGKLAHIWGDFWVEVRSLPFRLLLKFMIHFRSLQHGRR
jgi:hypothetical protein